MEQTQKKTAKPYSSSARKGEFRERAVRLAMEYRDEYQTEAAALTAIAGKLGCSPDSLRVWMRQVQRDGVERLGQTSAEKARSEPLRRHWFKPTGERVFCADPTRGLKTNRCPLPDRPLQMPEKGQRDGNPPRK